MANLNVTYGEMTEAATKLRNGKEDMLSKLTELMGVIDTLVQQGFNTDQASGQYHEQFSQFRTGTQQAVEGLEGIATYLDKAAEAFQNADTELANAIKG